ncbi:MAG: hypothetical protein ABMA00_16090 [Gemmatimonas sp.]
MTDFRRRLRGTIKNALVWGVGWSVLGFAATMVLRITGIVDAPVSVPDAVTMGLKIGLGGGIAGTAFAAFIAFRYRNRRIQDISWWKFGIGGAVVTAVSITGFVQSASLLGGSGLVPWRYMNPTLPMFAVFGFSVAAISVKLAQWATSRDDEFLGEEHNAQLAAGAGAVPLPQRARAEVNARAD